MIRERIFDIIDVSRPGLEIGALDKPIVTRAMGPIAYVDRGTRDEIVANYGGHGDVDKDAIVEVDHIWGEQTLLECVGGERRFAYVMTSHVIEHVPDMFGWLGEIASVLEDGGHGVFLAPDKRYTFDLLRRTSGASEFADAYIRRYRRPDGRQLFDHLFYIRDLVGGDMTAPTDAQARDLLAFCRAVNASADYHDVHCWVFTPRSMLEALDLASRLDLLPFEIEELTPTPTGSHEFLLVLRRLPDTLDLDARRAAFVASRDRIVLPDETEVPDPADALEALEAQLTIGRLSTRLEAIEASTSWRMTAPLRAAVTAVRGLLGAR